MSSRYQIRRSPLLAPLLVLFGATASRSFAEISESNLRIRFGWLFDHTFPLSEVVDAKKQRWPWFLGLGWHTNFLGQIGLIGSYRDVVEIRFARKNRVAMVIPRLACDRLSVSLEKPKEFLYALAQAERG